MGSHNGFEIPRFVAMLTHLVLLIALLWDVEQVAKLSLPWSDRSNKGIVENVVTELTAGLATGTALVSIEMTCFLIGASLFFPNQCLFSATCHSISLSILAYFLMSAFHKATYWFVFIALTVPPCISEVAILFGVLVLKKPI